MTSILTIGLIQCIIFLTLNLHKHNKTFADKILLLWLSIFGSHLLLLLLLEFNFHSLLVIVLARSIVLLHGPILFAYTLKVFMDNRNSYLSLHITPFVLISIAGLVLFEKNPVIWQDVLLLLKVISILSYPLLTMHWLKKMDTQLKNENSNNIVLEINWIRVLALLLLFSYVASILFVMSNQAFHWELDNNLDIIIYVIMITVMGYYGLKLGIVFKSGSKDAETNPSKKSYKHSPLDKHKILKIEQDIETYFLTKGGFLHPNFSISQLSNEVQIPKHHLSQVINEKMETSFYDIVNTNRVKYVKDQLMARGSSKFTLEALGYEAGFNTKAAFYSHFKKATGQTPGQFKKQMGID